MNKNFHYKNHSPNSVTLANNRANFSPAFSDWKPGASGSFDGKDALTEAFPSNQILAGCFAESFDQISPYLEKVSFSGDEFIYQPDDPIYYVYFPETVVISELQILEDGRTVETAMIGKEGVTGIPAIFNSQTVNCWTQVSLPGEALRIDFQILKDEFEFGGSLQASLFDFVGSYLGQVSQRVVCNTHHAVESRLCSWLLMLGDRSKCDEFLITQEKIARLLGVHRPSISNIAGSLRENNAIDYARGKITILDRRFLEQTACSCYQSLHENSQSFNIIAGQKNLSL